MLAGLGARRETVPEKGPGVGRTRGAGHTGGLGGSAPRRTVRRGVAWCLEATVNR